MEFNQKIHIGNILLCQPESMLCSFMMTREEEEAIRECAVEKASLGLESEKHRDWSPGQESLTREFLEKENLNPIEN
jgi:hypothetical protein